MSNPFFTNPLSFNQQGDQVSSENVFQVTQKENPFLQRSTTASELLNPFLKSGNAVSSFGAENYEAKLPFVDLTTPVDEPANPFLTKPLLGIETDYSTASIPQVNPCLQNESKSCSTEETYADSLSSNSKIFVQGIPKRFYCLEFLHNFFSKFGVIVNVKLKQHYSAIVTFLNRETAELAIKNGCYLGDDEASVKITWCIKEASNTAISSFPSRRESFVAFQHSLDELAARFQTTKCTDVSAKYAVLDAIDKRMRQVLQGGSQRSKAIQGTCLNMCPEKERYQREDRRQFGVFELRERINCEGDILELDHAKAVKEYSRSSADQDEPLPHELRPAFVLKFTMDYLVRNVMTDKNCMRSDWFDYVWNRTRAIRKDIIQQGLKGMRSIELIEKCARFHIFCSHHLCEEDLNVFDPKINLENLTKCLQTLKQMYEDVQKEKGQTSANEAEFRCYQILLNLNNADILREAVCFREEVRRSPQVIFALQTYSASQENNYVRFFKLLKSASFLNACLIHPYYNQIQQIALRTLSHSVGKANSTFSLSRLQNVLCFNSLTQTKAFCSHFGLAVSDESVQLNRMSFIQPDEQFPRVKSDLITAKCVTSVSEVINGGDLSPVEEYIPSNSFSTEGFYIGTYHKLPTTADLDLSDVHETEFYGDVPNNEHDLLYNEKEAEFQQVKSDHLAQEIFERQVKSIKDRLGSRFSKIADPDYNQEEDYEHTDDEDGDECDGAHQLMILREDFKNAADCVLEDVVHKETTLLVDELLKEIKEVLSCVEGSGNQALAFVCIEESRNVAIEVMEEEMDAWKDLKLQIVAEESASIAKSLVDGEISKAVTSCCQQIYSDACEKEKAAVLNERILLTHQEIVDRTIETILVQTVRSVITDEIIERRNRLEDCGKRLRHWKIQTLFKKWVHAYKAHTYVKTCLAEFPQSAPLFKTSKQLANELHPKRSRQHYKNTSSMPPSGCESSIHVYEQQTERSLEALRCPLDIANIYHDAVKIANAKSWKLGLYLSTPTSHKPNAISPSYLLEKFRNIPSNEIAPDILYESITCHSTNGSCTHVIAERVSGSENIIMTGYSGFVYFLHLTADHIVADLRRQKVSVHQFIRRAINTPVVFVVVCDVTNVTSSEMAKALEVEGSELAKVVKVDWRLKEAAKKVHETLTFALTWLIHNKQPDLLEQPLISFVEKYCSQHFFSTLLQHLHYCKTTHLQKPQPHDVISLFNNSLQAICDVSTDVTSCLNHQSDASFIQTKDLIMSLRLPAVNSCNPMDWNDSYQALTDFVEQMTGSRFSPLLHNVDALINRYVTRETNDNEFPWCPVLEACAMYRLSEMYTSERFVRSLHYIENNVTFNKRHGLWEHSRRNRLLRVENPMVTYETSQLSIEETINDVNIQLEAIEKSLRKRKSNEDCNLLARNQYQDLFNESMCLVESVHNQKEKSARKRRLLSECIDEGLDMFSPLNQTV